jgi:hypothetical protein
VKTAVGRALRAIPLLSAAPEKDADLIIGRHVEGRVSWVLRTGPEPSVYHQELAPDPFSPLLEGLSTQGLVWASAPHEAPSRARPLLSSDGDSLLWQDEKRLVSNIDLEKSNLLLHASFPILLFNLANAVDRELGGLPDQNFRLGEAVQFGRRAEWVGPAQVEFPDEQTISFATSSDVVLGTLQLLGLHRLKLGTVDMPFSVNLLSHEESNVLARKSESAVPSIRSQIAPHEHQADWFRLLLLVCAGLSLVGATMVLMRGKVPR